MYSNFSQPLSYYTQPQPRTLKFILGWQDVLQLTLGFGWNCEGEEKKEGPGRKLGSFFNIFKKTSFIL